MCYQKKFGNLKFENLKYIYFLFYHFFKKQNIEIRSFGKLLLAKLGTAIKLSFKESIIIFECIYFMIHLNNG